MLLRRITFSAPLLAFALSACGTGDDDMPRAESEKPQIRPTINPICLNDIYTEVGDTRNQPIQIQNLGRQDLTITGVSIIEDERSHFTVQGPDVSAVTELEFALFLVRYAPGAEGWDAAAVQIESNAENYPTLHVYLIGVSEPRDAMNYDPGPPPEIVRGSCMEE